MGVLGGYRVQGKNADDANGVIRLAVRMQEAGAAASEAPEGEAPAADESKEG